MRNKIDAICTLIRENDRFSIISHTSPDGDTLGTALALLNLVRDLGKDGEVICRDEVPFTYSFLPCASEIKLPKDATGYPVVISVDCADAARMGAAEEIFESAEKTANIDHHRTNTGYADNNLIDGSAAATGELMYDIVKELAHTPSHDVAVCLYTALITDTGNFAYANTTPHTLTIASELLALGINTYEINRLVYRTVPYPKKKLLGIAIMNMKLYMDGKVGLTTLTKAEMACVGAKEDATEGIIDHVRDVNTVEVAVLVRESGDDTFKVSLRSKISTDVSAIAARMGGGGHFRAAGYTAHGSMEKVCACALELVQEAMES